MFTIRQNLQSHFTQAKGIPGTHSLHCFSPLSKHEIGTKSISCDSNYSSIFNFGAKQILPNKLNMKQICTNSYVASVYDNHWFFSCVFSKDECDIQIKFMDPFGPDSSFYWLYQKEDICFVTLQSIINIVEPLTRASGRVCYFKEKDMNWADQKFYLLMRQTRN